MCKYSFFIDMMSMKMRKMRRKCRRARKPRKTAPGGQHFWSPPGAPQNDCAGHFCSADLSPEVTKLGVMIYICISFDTVC